MKFSFSTLGCPNWKWTEIISAAKDLGYDGIEIRGLGADIFAPDIKVFKEENTAKTRNDLNSLSLKISCFSSECLLEEDKDCTGLLKDYIDLASRLDCNNIRVLGDRAPAPSDKGVNEELVIKRLRELAPYAEDKNVNILLETNGVYANSDKALQVIKEVNSQNVALLWDIHHTYRFFSESFEKTYNRIGSYVKHIHIKDSVIENGKLIYKMIGKGDLPIKQLLLMLKDKNYQDFVSLEWVKRWNMDLEEPGIVFSHYINTVKDIVKK